MKWSCHHPRQCDETTFNVYVTIQIFASLRALKLLSKFKKLLEFRNKINAFLKGEQTERENLLPLIHKGNRRNLLLNRGLTDELVNVSDSGDVKETLGEMTL